ncbi:hypothetical protein B0H17DRAFT_1218832 [Mycena rosella]|uniref:GH18 domain-containing protein n=1 Tax=Mycena rosella TaxID=1033263 RepID=A0AAD7FI34_MYCRO|nr:hypothetical protein B0H17DRAFT_1218832 [Mycena rosella]
MVVKASVSLSKVNLGIGFDGRSFALASCTVFLDPALGEGFLSYGEIDYLIQSRDLTPQYNVTSLTMVLQYADQRIGYEDPYTIALKLDYVLKRAMPGVLIWAET